MKKLILFASAGLLMTTSLIGAAAFISDKIIKDELWPSIAQDHAKFQKSTTAILADLKILSENTPFKLTGKKSNAESFLSEKLATVPKELEATLKRYPRWMEDEAKLIELLQDPMLPNFDVTWVEELQHFDHWNLSDQKVMKEKLAQVPAANGLARIGILSTLPVPQLDKLNYATFLYFLRQHQSGKTYQGLQALRKAAFLHHTTGNLAGNMYAVHTLTVENKLSQFVKSTPEWISVSLDTIQAYRRLSHAWIGILQNANLGYFNSDFENFIKPELGVCAAVPESLATYVLVQDYLIPQALLEKKWSSDPEQGKDLILKTMLTCQSLEYKAFLEPTPDVEQPWIINKESQALIAREPATQSPEKIINYGRIPYARRVFGMMMVSLSRTDYLKLYSEKTM